MQMAHRNFNIFKKIVITMISWSLLLTPTANTLAQQEAEAPQSKTESNSTEKQATESDETNPNYCFDNGSNKNCTDGLVYNCHLESCVNKGDNENYNLEYVRCGGEEKCISSLKDDAKTFTEHKNAKPKDGTAQNLTYLSAIAQAAMGCAFLIGAGGATCKTDFFGATFVGVLMIAMALMTGLGGEYKKKFKSYKKELEKLENSDEKGWNHQSQRLALETEVRLLGDMEDAAEKKMKHHKKMQILLLLPIILSGICIAAWISGCPGSNPCSWTVIIVGAIAIMLEQQAHNIAKKAKASASSAKTKANKVLTKLKSRYNNQYTASNSQRVATNTPINTTSTQSEIQDQGINVDEYQNENIKNIPEMKINMGQLGKNGENAGNAINFKDIKAGWNKTKSTGNTKFINDAIDTNAAAMTKVARKVVLAASKQKDIPESAKKAFSALLNPNSQASRQFMNDELSKRLSPIQAALNYRQAGGSDAKNAIGENSKMKDSKNIAYDPSSKDYLKNIRAKLQEFESLVAEDDGMMAMANFGDPTVDSNAVDQLNQDNKDPKETIHKDSGVSLWKIISNRYNEIKLKKILD